MIFLISSILVSVLFGISFKIIAIKNINSFQTIIVNYIIAGSLGFLTTQSNVTPLNVFDQAWITFALGLGLVFIGSLFVISETTAKQGISVAQVSQRMSVVIPISLAIIFYNDKLTLTKVIGVLLAILAVYFVSHKEDGKKNESKYWWLFPLVIFIASGIIDSSINHVQSNLLQGNDLDVFLSTIFSTAFCFGAIVLAYQILVKKEKIDVKAIPAGIVLGVINYGTMFFLAKALGSGILESSALFPINNLSILTVSTIISVIVFKEKLSKKNWFGIGLSIMAILILGLLPILLN